MTANGDTGHCSAGVRQEAGAEKCQNERKSSSIYCCLHSDVEPEKRGAVKTQVKESSSFSGLAVRACVLTGFCQ